MSEETVPQWHPRTHDLTGRRFGRLVVVAYAGSWGMPGQMPRVRWRCLCDCGNHTVIRALDLVKKHTRSCGCLARDTRGKHRFIDLTGKTFTRLTVIERVHRPGRRTWWKCRCSCGVEKVVCGENLSGGGTRSCGCLREELFHKHGMSQSSEFGIWCKMKNRCLNPRDDGYEDYGGRGITVAPEWIDSFNQFYADVGPRPSLDYTLGRINNDRGYYPGNVEWQTIGVQRRNTRLTRRLTFNGETLPIVDWAARMGLSRDTLNARLALGWPVELALTAPLNSCRKVSSAPSAYKTRKQCYAAVANAVISGQLIKPVHCEHPGCLVTKIQAHHHRGYEREYWLDVVWLCHRHHAEAEKALRLWNEMAQLFQKASARMIESPSQLHGCKPNRLRHNR